MSIEFNSGTIPASPDIFGNGFDLARLPDLDGSPAAHIDAVNSPQLAVQDPQTDARIASLEKFLISALVENLLKLTPPHRETFQKQLEPCTAILNPPEKLQFLREVAAKFLSDKSSLECHFDKAPYNLPIPFSLSWIPNVKTQIHIACPALRVLLSPILLPLTPYHAHYLELIQKVVRECTQQKSKQNHTTTITFSQANTQYECTFSLAQIILMFFPEQLAQVVKAHPKEDFIDSYKDICSTHSFSFSDRRVNCKKTSKNYFIESLLLADALPVLLTPTNLNENLLKRIGFHLACFLHEGVLNSEILLSERILRSTFKATTQLLEKLPFLTSERCGLAGTVYDAMQVILRKKPSSMEAGQMVSRPSDYSQYQAHKAKFLELPYLSFTIRDLMASSHQDWRTKLIGKKMPLTKVVGKFLLQRLENSPQGLHIVVSSRSYWFDADLLRFPFLDGMIAAWQQAALNLDKSVLVELYIDRCIKALTQKLRYKAPLLARDFSCAVLGMLPLIDAKLLYEDARFLKILFTGFESFSNQHIVDLAVFMHDPQGKMDIIQQIKHAITHTLPWVKSDHLLQILSNLSKLCESSANPDDFRSVLLYFAEKMPQSNGADKRDHAFAEMLFRAYLASIRPRSLPFDAVPQNLLDFTTDQFHVCHKKEEFLEFINTYKESPGSHTLCLTSIDALGQGDLLKKLASSITSCFYVHDPHVKGAQVQAVTNIVGSEKMIILSPDSQSNCFLKDLPSVDL